MTQFGPNPDYRSDLPEDQLCGCEESEHLRAELGTAHVRIARQAAVIERVRRLLVHLPGEHRDFLIQEALAAAPEHAAGCRYEQEYPALDPDDCPRCEPNHTSKADAWKPPTPSHLGGLLDAATARVAELERLCTGYRQTAERECELADAATARAEAAERDRDANRAEMARRFDLLHRSESEAADLRAEVERLRLIAELIDKSTEEWEFLRAKARQLVAANALLVRLSDYLNPTTAIAEAVRAYLSGQIATPAPTGREAAERKVLEAWAGVPLETLYLWATHPSEHVRNVCRAELARREAQRG